MNLKIGIVGLPNVGKSTLFNALTKSQKAAAENFPFCTIDPNVGLVEVPDERMEKLAAIVNPEKVMKSTVEFVDIAGLVEGASKGEGLGNQFLSHIRECDAICHVVRDFENADIHHVNGSPNPGQDLAIILMELVLADLQSIEKQIERITKKARSGDKDSNKQLEVMKKIQKVLADGQLAFTAELDDKEEQQIFKHFQLLTSKKYMVVANTTEESFVDFDEAAFRKKADVADHIPVIPISAQIESELSQLSDEDSREFLEAIGAEKSGIEILIKQAFEVLHLDNYFTAGVTEVRSWTIHHGATAPQAAGEIHTDFEKGFIKADIISYEDFIEYGGEAGAKEAGKMRIEGKEYIVKNGDVIHFKFNN